jgi:hypothetical protein
MNRSRRRRIAHVVPVTLVVATVVLIPALAPATVEEQRARLPPPAQPDTCQNPVEGVWKSLRWYEGNGAWYSFELEIHQSGNTLSGSIRAHSWDTGPRETEPGPCRAGLSHWIVFQTALGSVDRNLRIDFAATRWAVERTFCGASPFGYNLDHFRGVIDTRLQEFQSVNNDGGAQIDEPTVFRRVRCFEPQQPPHPYVAPPPLQPPRRGWSCNNRR